MMLRVQDVPTAISVPTLWWTLLDQDGVSQPVGCDPIGGRMSDIYLSIHNSSKITAMKQR